MDALGYPLFFLLTGGQKADVSQAKALLANWNGFFIILDKGYDADHLVEFIEERGAFAVVPPRENRNEMRFYDEHLYQERHLVECFFNKLKRYRRVFSRFEKLASRFLGFCSFAASLIWMR